MKLFRSLSFFTRVALTGALAIPAALPPLAQAQAPATLDQQDAAKAAEALEAGKLEEAAGLYEGIPVKYPTSPLIPQSKLRLGYVYFRMQQYDKAAKTLNEAAATKGVTADVVELAMSLVPQVLSAKAGAASARDPQRGKLFEEAIKGYDNFLTKFPQSEEVESANYGKAVALYQVEKYLEAIGALRINLTRFVNSESVLDSQFLMALTMGTVSNQNAQKEVKPDPFVNYDNAEKMLADIVRKGEDRSFNIVLANDSRFQIAELSYARAGFTKDEAQKEQLYQKALDGYRGLGGKEYMLGAQKARLERAKAALGQARASRDPAQIKRFTRVLEKEQEKLSTIEARPDPTVAARIKMAEVFYQTGKMDETRVVMNSVKPLVGEDDEQKKAIAYYIAISYARQNSDTQGAVPDLVQKTESTYDAFFSAYPRDPIAENLGIMVGSGFTKSAPQKAEKYFADQTRDYPNSTLGPLARTFQAAALLEQEKYDEAMEAYRAILKTNPAPTVAAAAEYGVATVLMQQKRFAEAIPEFKTVRDKYTGTTQATEASFYYAQLLLQHADNGPKAALPEFQAFVKNNPQHILFPSALFFLGQAQSGENRRAEALATFKKIATDFPKSEVAPYSYFSRAEILMREEPPKTDDVVALMQEFINGYPESQQLYQAYDFLAQIQTSQKKEVEAIETYEGFVKQKPQNSMASQALLKVGTKWRDFALTQGRFTMLNPDQRTTWVKTMDSSINAAERVVRQYPESTQVALALNLLLDDLKDKVNAKLMTEADLDSYFQKLADEFKDKQAAHSKIIFTLAGNLIGRDRPKALELMAGVYDPKLKYAPEDMDLYGTGLIDQKKLDEAEKVYKKLAEDYPIPAGTEPKLAARDIQEAQSMALYGTGKVLRDQNKTAEAKARFDELEKLYPWSPKMLAANYGIAEGLFDEKKFEDAQKRLITVTGATKAPAELRANAMLLLGKVQEEMGNYEAAIANYIKIYKFFPSLAKPASEGLWRGGQLLEKQGIGQLPIATPTPRAVPAKKPAGPAAPAAAPATAGAAAPAAAPATAGQAAPAAATAAQ